MLTWLTFFLCPFPVPMPTMDHSDHKPTHNGFSPQPARQPYRRRRIVWGLLALFALVFFFGAPWEFPAAGLSSTSRANIAHLTKPTVSVPDEIYGLLHLVTRDDGRLLRLHDPSTDPRKPMRLSMYEKEGNWTRYHEELEEHYPVVVFSKASSLFFTV